MGPGAGLVEEYPIDYSVPCRLLLVMHVPCQHFDLLSYLGPNACAQDRAGGRAEAEPASLSRAASSQCFKQRGSDFDEQVVPFPPLTAETASSLKEALSSPHQNVIL